MKKIKEPPEFAGQVSYNSTQPIPPEQPSGKSFSEGLPTLMTPPLFIPSNPDIPQQSQIPLIPQVAPPIPIISNQNETKNVLPITCPIDNKDDSIQSLSALVAGGRSSGSFSGPSGGVAYVDGKYGYVSGTTHLYGSLTSDLARSLAAPLPPKEVRFWSLIGWSFLFILTFWTIIGPFLVWPRFKESIATIPENQKKVFTPGLNFACLILLFYGWHPVLWVFWWIVKKKFVERLEYPRRYAQWEQAYFKWDKLFYCHRCGIFFNPETKEYYHPSQLYSYLRIYEYEL